MKLGCCSAASLLTNSTSNPLCCLSSYKHTSTNPNREADQTELLPPKMNHTAAQVRVISQCAISPKLTAKESETVYHLTPYDLAMLSVDYIQKGLLFTKPPTPPIATILNQLKHSLSQTLTQFPPLLGRLATKKQTNPPSYSVYLDCTNPSGAQFIHAIANLTISDVLRPHDVPKIVESFFAFTDGAMNHDGHTKPLVAIQLTELVDGIFIGCSFNHAIADGTSFWHFFNTWSEISRGENIECISRPPIIDRWFLDGHDSIINLPFNHQDDFIKKYTPPPLREIMFHFSAKSIALLKSKANEEANTNKISSFQALNALVWRCITRARNLAVDQITNCRLAINNRSRLIPPLSNDYFGNCIQTVCGSTTVAELLENNIGWSAMMLHVAVENHTDEKIRNWVQEWMKNPAVYQLGRFFDVYSMMMGSSPRFDMYGNEFGWGKVLGVRSGQGNKFDGKVSSYPGREGKGSVDLEVCLGHVFMSKLLLDDEFMGVVSVC